LAAGQGFAAIVWQTAVEKTHSNYYSMGHHFNKIAILGRDGDPRVAEPMKALATHLTKIGVDVLAADTVSLNLQVTRVAESALADQADLFIAIGGDGTMLYAGNLARDKGVPLLGINRGRLGFLADVTPDEMLTSVDHVLAGNFSRESRLLLEARLISADGEEITAVAINDVVLQRRETGRMVDFETRVAGRYVNTHSGDGLIVATPTGSTAYALSCGGPIIEPQLDVVVVVPVCPHTLTDRPIVIPASQPIEVRLLRRDDTNAEISVDGHSIGAIRPKDRLLIGPASSRITLIHPPGYDFYGTLRSKLYWGQNSRIRDNDARTE
jgi:NAD+ kinase